MGCENNDKGCPHGCIYRSFCRSCRKEEEERRRPRGVRGGGAGVSADWLKDRGEGGAYEHSSAETSGGGGLDPSATFPASSQEELG
jgi:hypothetical protein